MSELLPKSTRRVVTDHAWENRSGTIARAAFFHIDARFSEELLARLPKPLVLTR